MGNAVDKAMCVDLSKLPPADFKAIVEESYTVQRNPKKKGDPSPGEVGAMEDEGWMISSEPHGKYCTSGDSFGAHATNQYTDRKGNYVWKFHMRNRIQDPNRHVCGWRTCHPGKRTFWPTRLKTQAEREEWWQWLDSCVDGLDPPITTIV